MNSLMLAPLLDGNVIGSDSYGNGAIVAISCIIMVFVILALIILVTYVVNILINKFSKNESIENKSETENHTENKLDLSDEDAVVATLIASIDLRSETKKNVKVISVKEIK